jgi:nucleoid-associated protein Lsr2
VVGCHHFVTRGEATWRGHGNTERRTWNSGDTELVEEITVAQKVQVILTDDLDGSEADDTVSFAIDGVSYDIDLSEGNAEALRGVFGPYILAARRVGGRYKVASRQGAKKPAAASTLDVGDVRAWARENGFQVSDRGRVSGEVKAAYEAAH